MPERSRIYDVPGRENMIEPRQPKIDNHYPVSDPSRNPYSPPSQSRIYDVPGRENMIEPRAQRKTS